jgi:hypothetical protein
MLAFWREKNETVIAVLMKAQILLQYVIFKKSFATSAYLLHSVPT